MSSSSREAEFLRSLSAVYRDLFALTVSIVGNRNDVDDALQEICVVLLQKYDDFESGTNFKKWACTVAFNVAKAYARKRRRELNVGLGDEALQKVAHVHAGAGELLELKQEILDRCLEKLSAGDRDFLAECYQLPAHSTFSDVAKARGRTVHAIYVRLKRLRNRLTECVNRSLGRQK